MSKVFQYTFVEPEAPTGADFDVLQTIAALTGELGYSPALSAVGKCYGITRQAVHQRVKSLRAKGLIEEQPFPGRQGVVLSHNGKLALETALGAGLKA